MPNRILILSASVGAGHLRAAQAVEAAVRELRPDALVKHIDVLQLTNPTFRRLYAQAYLDLVNKVPHVLGYFYDLMNQPRSPKSKGDRLRRLTDRLNLLKLCDLLECNDWDVVVNTHFLPAEIIAGLRRKRRIHTPQITVTTDFETHRAWVHSPTDRYCTATDEGAANLEQWGVRRELISVTGIPIHPIFSKTKSREQCLRSQQLVGDRPIILQLAGGFGVGPIAKLYRALLEIERPLEIVVVTGRNTKVKSQLEKVDSPARHRVKILGFTDQMDELLRAADLVLSKPGGLTTSECLACGTPMAVVNPIPGQESRNSDFLLENGAAIKINNLGTLRHKLTQLLDDPDKLKQLKCNARTLGRPRAAFDVAQMALSMRGLS